MEFRDRRDGSVTDGSFKSMGDVKKANAAAGQTWFGKSEQRFFGSRVGNTLHSGPGGHYFTTSEEAPPVDGQLAGPRRAYSVRQAHPDGTIGTVGEFQGHPTRSSAVREAQRRASGA